MRSLPVLFTLNLFRVYTIKNKGEHARPLSVKIILKIQIKLTGLEKDNFFNIKSIQFFKMEKPASPFNYYVHDLNDLNTR